jgi:Flp pilus assembly protein TadB
MGKTADMTICAQPGNDTRARGPYRVLMLRFLMLIGAVIVVALVVGAIVHLFFMLLVVALIILGCSLLFRVSRIGRRSAERRR